MSTSVLWNLFGFLLTGLTMLIIVASPNQLYAVFLLPVLAVFWRELTDAAR